MKRSLMTFLILGLMTGSVATAEVKGPNRVERTVEGSYGTQRRSPAAIRCWVHSRA